MFSARNFNRSKPFLFILILFPSLLWAYQFVTGNLGVNPIEKLMDELGLMALRLIIVTLMITSLSNIKILKSIVVFRRMVGLFAFYYVCLHFSTYIVLDHFLDIQFIIQDIMKRPFITFGFISFIFLIPLASTSTNKIIKKLGFKLWKKIGNRDQLQTLIAGHMPQITPDRILNKVFSVPKKYVKPMLDLKNYNLTEIKLIVKGGFENQEDIDFAQQGGFDTIKDVRKARKLFCNTWEEMIAVQTNEWEDGNEMRHAMRQGFFENEKDLFTLTTEKNNHIKWNKQSIIWARNSTKDSLERLTNFSSIKSMEFYDYLFTVEEDMFRTDRLMGEYNKLAVPGAKITSEEKFEDFLSQFPDVVDVTNGGLTKILLNSKGVKKIHPRINFNSYPTIKKSRTKLSKSLKKSLAENNLNEASLDSYSWLTEQVRSHLGISQKEELQIVDSCKELLDLSKRETDKLHKTRMARNWVGHKEAEQKVEPSWTYVEYCLNLSERISSL